MNKDKIRILISRSQVKVFGLSLVRQLLLITGMLVWVNCSRSGQEALTGVETTNGIVGNITLDGGDVNGTVVSLVPQDYTPIGSDSQNVIQFTLGKNGDFEFHGLSSGSYNLVAQHPMGNASAIIQNVMVTDSSVTKVGENKLQNTGALLISLAGSDVSENGYMYLLGTEIFVQLQEKDLQEETVTLTEVPVGEYTLFYQEVDLVIPIVFKDSIILNKPDTISLEPFVQWKVHRDLIINTTVSGIKLNEILTGFPLLVRLDDNNFDFSLGNSDGSDLRISNVAGTPLDYEIERWDFSNKIGEVWVKIDTMFMDSVLILKIHFGNENVESISNGARVFDTLNGFGAVWHLGEESGGVDNDGIYRNSTEDVNHGKDNIFSSGKTGIIAKGQEFWDGDRIEVENPTDRLKPKNTFTLSSWFKTNTLDSMGGQLLTMGEDYGYRIKPGNMIRAYIFDGNAKLDTNIYLDSQVNLINLLDNEWHYSVVTLDGKWLKLYLDGALVDSSEFIKELIEYERGPNFIIGVHGNGSTNRDFHGFIDEARMSFVGRSSEWVRMNYESQKLDQKLWRLE